MVTYLCVHFSSYIAAILFVFAFSFATNSNVGVFLKCLKRTCYVTLKRKEMFFRFCCFSCRAFFCRFLVPNAFLFGSDEYSTVPKKTSKVIIERDTTRNQVRSPTSQIPTSPQTPVFPPKLPFVFESP